MAPPSGGKTIARLAQKADELTGGRLSQQEIIRKPYYKILSLTNYYDFEDRNREFETHTFDGYDLLLDTAEDHQRAVADGEIDHELAAFEDLIDEGDTVYDVGANIGVFSVYATANTDDCQLLAQEPEPATFDHLERNVAINSFAERITCLQKAVTDQTGEVELYISGVENQATHSLTRMTQHGGETVQIQATTVDELAATYSAPNTVKLDVEGAEQKVLAGMKETLESDVDILIDVHDEPLKEMGGSPESVFEMLSNHGSLYELTPAGREPVADSSALTAPTTLVVEA